MSGSADRPASTLHGQWIGTYEGASIGLLMLDLEPKGDECHGTAYLGEPHPNLSALAQVRFSGNVGAVEAAVDHIYPVDPRVGMVRPWEEIKDQFPGRSVASSATLRAQATEVVGLTPEQRPEIGLRLEWKTDTGATGIAHLRRRDLGQSSDLPASKMTWNEFKATIGASSPPGALFRGQSKPWRLQTSFHRLKRLNLRRLVTEDMEQAHPYVAAATNLRFDRGGGDELAMLSLMQHHGYPTPLLDWTRSPYIAAFFAYRGLRLSEPDANWVRIFSFDQQRWRQRIPPLSSPLVCVSPHASLLDLLPLANQRMMPQQAVSMFTNMADVEHFMDAVSKQNGRETYLRAVDLPATERNVVLRDLRFMGITAASMFPGLDGLFEDLRERNFDMSG